VTSEDAQWVTEWIAGTRQLTSEQLRRADVNASGTITAADATAIAQYAVGTIDSFVAAYGAGLYNILGVEAILVDGAERLLTLPWTAHSKYARLAMSCVGGTAAAYWVSRATFAGKNV
ncbi:MAG: dockerin type I domain-containing protein, partial [Dehalococcoidales bacterium]|nr:dockerin type I domain-containing protein [Dehalococcoidales bacterium]